MAAPQPTIGTIPFDVTEPTWQTYQYTDFDDGSLGEWAIYPPYLLVPNGTGWAVQFQSDSIANIDSVVFTFYDVAAQARFLLSSGTAYVHARISLEGEYYATLSMDGQLELYRSGMVLLGSATISPFDANTWVTIRLTTIQDSIRVAVDGITHIVYTDSDPLPRGDVKYSVEFDYIPPGEPVPVRFALLDDLLVQIPKPPLAPASDLFGSAYLLPDMLGIVTIDTIGHTTVTATDPYPCVMNRTNTVWFQYTPTRNGWYRVSTFGSSYETVMGAYTGHESALTEIACNKVAPDTTVPVMNIPVTAGTPIFIMVANKVRQELATSDALRLRYEPIYSDFIGLYSPPGAQWYLRSALTAGTPDYAPQFGFANTQPVVCDWNGNGTDTLGVFDPDSGRLYLRDRNDVGGTSYPVFAYGTGGLALCGDWNGDGLDTIGVYYPSTGLFYLRDSLDAGAPNYQFPFGFDGTLPLAGDWNGDGRDGIGIYDVGTGYWYLRDALSSGVPDYQFTYGFRGAQPIVGDWDGDGRDGIGIYHVATGNWYLRNTLASGSPSYPFFAYGGFGISVAGTWNLPGQFGAFSLENGAIISDGPQLPPFTGDWEAIQRASAESPNG